MLSGKGMWIWKVGICEGGDPDGQHANLVRIADKAQEAGLTHVLFKIANGVYNYNVSTDLPRLVQLFNERGITPIGWHYVYGLDPIAEANKAAERVIQLGLPGYVIDAESEWKAPGMAAKAVTFMNRLKDRLPDNVWVGLSSFRYPVYHPEFPWQEFLTRVDLNLPQVYWMQAHNPAYQLNRCLGEFAALNARFGIHVPIFPVGAAFYEHGWQPTVAELQAFMQAAKDANLAGFNLWEWWFAASGIPELWPVIRDFNWGEEEDWTGRTVTPCHDGVSVRDINGNLIARLEPGVSVSVQKDEMDGRLRIRGYLPKGEMRLV